MPQKVSSHKEAQKAQKEAHSKNDLLYLLCLCVAYFVTIDLTWLRFRSVTIPLRRYQTPSLVRQTSSASILPPLVSMITGLPPCRVPIPGPLVETGSVVERVCAVEIPFGEAFGDGTGDGEGETVGEGDGSVAGEGVGDGSTVVEVCVAAEVVRGCCLKP